MAKTFDLSILFKIIDRATGPLKSIGHKLKGLENKMKAFGGRMRVIGRQMKDVGRDLSMKITAPLVAMGAGAFKASLDFNKAMGQIATLIPKQTKRVGELKSSIQDLAVSTGVSTGNIAEGVYQLVSAFGDSADSMKKMDIAVKVGMAGRASMADSINLLSAVQLAYNDKSTETTKKVADMAFEMVKAGKTTIPELASSIGLVTPFAAQLKLGLDEVFGSLGAMAGVTGTTSEAATQLAAVMRGFVKPQKEMITLAKGLGYASTAQMFSELGLVKSLKLLVKYTKGSETEMAKLLGGRIEGIKALFYLTKNEERHAEMIDKSKKSVGALDDAFVAATKTVDKFGTEWRKFKQVIITSAQKLGDELAPMIIKISEYIKKFMIWFNKLSPETREWIIYIGLAVAAIGPLLLVLGSAISFIGLMSTGLTAMGTSLGAVAVAAGPVIVAVGLLATAAALWVKNWKEIKIFFMDFWVNLNFEVERFIGLIKKIPVIGKYIGAPTGIKGYESVLKMGPGIAAQSTEHKVTVEVRGKDGAEGRVTEAKKIKGDADLDVISEVGAGSYIVPMGG